MEAQENDDEIFVYMGGDQRVPDGVRRARIHKSVKIIRKLAFYHRWYLISVELHDGIEIIEENAFYGCRWLRGGIKLLGVKIIKECAFYNCTALTDVEFGDKLETIETASFYSCRKLRNIIMPSVGTIGVRAFAECKQLAELDLPEDLETLEYKAFYGCQHVERIIMPLKDDMVAVNVFNGCSNLTSLSLGGGTHNTVASLHLETWRSEMKDEINRINHVLPNTEAKTTEIRRWMRSVNRRFNHYKTEHALLLKEAKTLLELAVWKAKIDQNEERLKPDTQSERRTQRITSGASTIIKNVLPFLELK